MMEIIQSVKDAAMSSEIIFILLCVVGLYLAFKVMRGVGRIVFTLLSIVSAVKWLLWLM